VPGALIGNLCPTAVFYVPVSSIGVASSPDLSLRVEPHSYLRSHLYFLSGVSLIGSFWVSLALFLRVPGTSSGAWSMHHGSPG
jgi:hypothetical protein